MISRNEIANMSGHRRKLDKFKKFNVKKIFIFRRNFGVE
jgi:hypothetical protein